METPIEALSVTHKRLQEIDHGQDLRIPQVVWNERAYFLYQGGQHQHHREACGWRGALKLSDDEKFDLVAKEATARHIFTMRTLGLVAVADRVRLIQLINRPVPPTLPWTRRRRPSRFAETRGQRVVPLDLFRTSE